MKKKIYLIAAIAIFGFAAITQAQVPSYVPTNGLVGWWPFNGNANDESGNGNNGTVYGASLTTDRNGNQNSAYSMTLNSDDITGNAIGLDNQSFSVSLWVWINGMQYCTMNCFKFGGTAQSATDGGYRIYADLWGEEIGVQITSGSQNWVRSFNNNLQQWHHIVGTYSSNQLTLFIDGVLDSSLILSSIIIPFTQTLFYIGNNGNINNNAINQRKLDDIGVWSRAITPAEVTALFNSQTCANNLTITPTNNQLVSGDTANFNANTSDPNPSFVWQSDFGQGFQTLNNYGSYSGVNTNALSISNVQLQNHTQPIRVISTSGNCIDTSNDATINITDTCIVSLNDTITTLISVTDTLIINTNITGLLPPNNLNTIKVFPNPAKDHITVDYGNFASMNDYTLKISNSLGQIVFTTLINQQSSFLDLSAWSGNGIYYVQIIDTQNNTIENRKIVLQ